MTTTLPNQASADVHDWIKILAGPGAHSQGQKDRAMEALLPTIQEAARRAASRFERRWWQELLAEAPLIIWEKLDRFDPARGRFQAFCLTILRHAFVDFVRKAARYEAAGAADGDEYHEREAPSDDEADEAAKSHWQGSQRGRPAAGTHA